MRTLLHVCVFIGKGVPFRMLVEVGFKEVLGMIWDMAGLLFDSKTCTSGGIILALGSVCCNKQKNWVCTRVHFQSTSHRQCEDQGPTLNPKPTLCTTIIHLRVVNVGHLVHITYSVDFKLHVGSRYDHHRHDHLLMQ
jgi:hypothetical protein